MTSSPSEDKTCRMCGYADQSNLNIFQTREIQKKILALYPIVLYRSDPLPKNICVKCYGNTLTRFDEYLRIAKIQNKWVTNVRNNQPNNPYIRVLDKIEETNHNLLSILEDIAEESIDETFSILKFHGTNFPEDIGTKSALHNANQNFCGTNVIREHSNRILLSHLKGENQNYKLTGVGSNSSVKSAADFKNFPKNKCRFCFKVLPNEKFLAYHQVKFHLNISIFKSFTKKPLAKRLRAGQAVKINDKVCLRCNNCWKCFEDYDSILNHWQNKRCDFYCLICGTEFSNDPGNLRKHIKSNHLLQYKAYEMLIKKSRNIKTSSVSSSSVKEKRHNMISSPKQFYDTEDSSNSLMPGFKKEPFEFVGFNEKPKIPVLKLTRKTNSVREEFDIKIEDNSNSPIYENSPNHDYSGNEAADKPLLRVKNISELQSQPKDGDDDYDDDEEDDDDDDDVEYIGLDEFALNTINLENKSCDSVLEDISNET